MTLYYAIFIDQCLAKPSSEKFPHVADGKYRDPIQHAEN